MLGDALDALAADVDRRRRRRHGASERSTAAWG
jgi:hypothetical protein